jgi:hypothetical protein
MRFGVRLTGWLVRRAHHGNRVRSARSHNGRTRCDAMKSRSLPTLLPETKLGLSSLRTAPGLMEALVSPGFVEAAPLWSSQRPYSPILPRPLSTVRSVAASALSDWSSVIG